MLDTDTIVDYLYANSLAVRDVVNNDSNPNEKSTVVVGGDNANIVVLHDGEKAEVVLIKSDGVRILDSVDNYNSIVANVKSLLPVRPKLPKGPMA
ncbi:MAG: hypothetical protein U9P00_05965 [Pseudomonadota bacterium]|nr:hypothetical protein [Pseudomonadota bacterium]